MKREREKIICTICTRIGVFFFSAAGNNNKSKKDRTKPVLPDRGRAVMMDVDDVCQSWRCKAAHRLAALQPEYSYNVLLQRFCVSPVYCIVKPGQSGSELEAEPEAETGTETSGSVRGFLDVMRKAAGLYSYYRVQSTECC